MKKTYTHATRVKRIGTSLYQVQRRRPDGKWVWLSPMAYTSIDAGNAAKAEWDEIWAKAKRR